MFYLYVRYGDNKTYSPTVANMINKAIELNPRKRNQVELPNELFLIYLFGSNDLLISDYRKKGLIKHILNEDTISDIIIKNKYVSYEEFTKRIKTLDEIKLYIDKNIFNIEGDFKQELDNTLGFGDTNLVNIKAEINQQLTKSILNRLDFFHNEATNGMIKNLICVGRDDNGVTEVFNEKTFNRKMSIEVKEDENGFHNIGDIISELKKYY